MARMISLGGLEDMKQNDEYLPYIEWNRESLEKWFEGKFTKRTLYIDEYLFITKFIREIEPEIIIDVGTFLGACGYILGTSSPKLKTLYSLDHHHGPTYKGPYKGLVETKDYGKYLPEYCIFKKYGYEWELPPILEEHKGDNVFVFFDAGKHPLKIAQQIQMAYQFNTLHIGFHDTGLKQVRDTINEFVRLYMYEICGEKQGEGLAGVTLLRLI